MDPCRATAACTAAVAPVTSSDCMARLTFISLCTDTSSSSVAAAGAAAAQGAQALCKCRWALQCQGLVAHEQVGTHKLCAAYFDNGWLFLRTV
jgi:hypothetical protein